MQTPWPLGTTSLRACPFPGGRPRPRPVEGGLVAASVNIDEDGLVDASGHEEVTTYVLMED